jgi:hypothetical protein
MCFAISASFALTSTSTRYPKWKAFAIALDTSWLLAGAPLAVLQVKWVLLGVLPVGQFALEGRWIPLKDVKLWLLYDICVVFQVLAATATTFWAAVHSLGKALAVKLQTLWLGATTLGSRSHSHGIIRVNFHLWTRFDNVRHWHVLALGKVFLLLTFSAIFLVHE